MNQQAAAIPALLDLLAQSFNLGADGIGLSRLDLLAREVVPCDQESADELGAPPPRQHLDVDVHLLDLRARRGDSRRLCLEDLGQGDAVAASSGSSHHAIVPPPRTAVPNLRGTVLDLGPV
jgi:hypothetical protein